MALYVKDSEVDAMASRLAEIRKISKTEALRQALRRELAEQENAPSRIDEARTFIRALNAGRDKSKTPPLTKDFIDSLYE
ncbi:type II toxin-antitoxin system VapB family antitoxin [Rhizobium terrae]|uniref:type II toxin-antitoxin system VapB family antitoxin n=1 Tax=Rhizobium terrae TaxID=2171756 RepID=UPI000E3BE462|nr:type II toxin-antitoxin system VapB family antitoxin [Rhizobium terrae]